MSYQIVDNVFKRAPHKGATFVVLAALATFARPNGVAYPAQTTLVQRSRLSLRAVRNAIHALIEAGDVEIMRAGSGVSSTQYRFSEMYMVDDREAPAAALERHEVPGREAPAAAQGGTSCRPERHEVPGREARGAALERHAVPPNQLESVRESVNESVNESAQAREELRERVSIMFGRQLGSSWSKAEMIALEAVESLGTSESDLVALSRYYRSRSIPAATDYRRRTVGSLLEHWHGELDRARSWVREQTRRSNSIL
jgi:hypothetical protein